jgi:hypothetical protein
MLCALATLAAPVGLLVLASALGWSATLGAPSARATAFGLSDQHETSFSDPRFATLPIDHVRLMVPWNVAITDPEPTARWLDTAFGLGLTPLVAFQHAAGERCPDAPCRLPSTGEYRDAVAAFRARWPRVREFTPWNEPNHPSQPTVSSPAAAAALHDALRRDCAGCTVTAGDVVDSASMRGWVREYRAALRTAPLVWSLHNYGDVIYDRPSYTEWLLNLVSEPVWITETGGIARFSAHGQEIMALDEERAAASVRKALELIAAHRDRIERAYVYQWVAAPHEAFDSGLIRPDGAERPSLGVVREALGARPAPRPKPDGAGAGQTGVGQTARPGRRRPQRGAGRDGALTQWLGSGAAPRTGTRRPRRVRGGYRLRVRCFAGRRRCRGRVTLSAAAGAGGARSVLGARVLRLRGRGWRPVTVRVAPRGLRRARSLRDWTLVATVVVRDPPRLTERSWPGRGL